MPIDYELEDTLALRKLKEAAALRQADISPQGQMRGRMYIPDYAPMSNAVLDRISGQRRETEATDQLRNLSQQQDQEVQDYIGQMRTPGTVLKKTLRQGEGPLVQPNIDETQAPMSAEEENQRQMGLSMEAMRLPKARGMATQFVNSGVGFPEKQAQLKAQQDLLREQQAARLQQARQQAAMLEEGRNQRASEQGALRMTLAGMAASNRSTANSNADLQRELLQARIDKLKEGPKPTAAETKVKAAEENAVKSAERVDGLVKEAEANKGAFGIVPAAASMLPNIVGSRITSKALSEKEQVTRARVMTEGAKIIHDVYGAALSRGEAARADSWAPNPNDDYDTIVRKMKAAKAYSNEIAGKSAPAPTAPAAGGAYDSDKEARYQAWKKAQGM